MTETSSLHDRLSAVLDREYQSLTRGNLKDIEKLGLDKLALLEQIGVPDPSDLAGFESLRRRLVRNQILAMSAIDGMRSAIARAREVRAVSETLGCYGSDGKDKSVEMRRVHALSKRS